MICVHDLSARRPAGTKSHGKTFWQEDPHYISIVRSQYLISILISKIESKAISYTAIHCVTDIFMQGPHL